MAYIPLSILFFAGLLSFAIGGPMVYDKKSHSEEVMNMMDDKRSHSEDAVNMMDEKALRFLDGMMSCTTNRTFLETVVDFGFYGCYCGFGGFGTPVDGVDRCCQTHDQCYGATHIKEGGVCYLNVVTYAIPYKDELHQCDTEDAYVTCADIDQYKWYDPLPKCAVAICNCDRALAECIAKEPFHEEYRFYNRLKCLNNVSDKHDKPAQP